MSEMIAVKAIHGDDTRRFSVDPALKFAGLKEEVKARFGLSEDNLTLTFKDDEGELCRVTGDAELTEAVRIAASLKPPILRVHIEVLVEGDKAKTGEDVGQDKLGESARQVLAALEIPEEDALRFLSSINLVEEAQKYRSFVPLLFRMQGMHGSAPPTETAPETASTVHDGVVCDGCQMCPIRGIRFKSVTRDDFDLCETCVKKEPHTQDTYRKIEPPAAEHPPCDMMRGMMRDMMGNGACHKWGQSAAGPSNASMLPEGVIHPGAKGQAVASLQQVLIQLGHLHPGAVRWGRGNFGPRTTQVIAALQQANGQAPTGIYDGAIRTKLAEQLNGASPAAAVADCACKFEGGAHPSGKCPSTNGPIDASILPEGLLQFGMRGPAVASLQQALIQLGHLHPGAIRWGRGMFGPRTMQAIAALQQASGEAPTGIYDGAIRSKLAEQLDGVSSASPTTAAHGGCASWRRGHYSSRFVSDKSLPDGAKVQPGHKFTKTWTLRNDGSTVWPETASLVFVKGDRLHEDDVKLVGKVEPGAEVDVSVEMFAPEPAGRYVSFWRLSAVGEAERGRNRPPLIGGFGQRVWLQVLVDGEACELSSDENEAEAEERIESAHHIAGKPLEQWGIAELKKELKAHGADFSECVEKDDLVSLLRATLDSQHAPQREPEKPEVDSSSLQVEEGIKAACSAFGVPIDDISPLLGHLQPFLQHLQQQQGQPQQPPNFDLGALMQNAMPFLNAMGTAPAPAPAPGPTGAPAPAAAEAVAPAATSAPAPVVAESPPTVPSEAAEVAEPIEELKLPDATKQKLMQLREMGFLDDAENLAALDQVDGRVEKAVEILFSGM